LFELKMNNSEKSDSPGDLKVGRWCVQKIRKRWKRATGGMGVIITGWLFFSECFVGWRRRWVDDERLSHSVTNREFLKYTHTPRKHIKREEEKYIRTHDQSFRSFSPKAKVTWLSSLLVYAPPTTYTHTHVQLFFSPSPLIYTHTHTLRT
jgi:hypothetical protein